MVERTDMTSPSPGTDRLTTAELVERLSRFDGPPEQFLVNLLAMQCHIASAEAGAILRTGQAGRAEVLAVHPPLPAGTTAPSWLAQVVESAVQAVSDGRTISKPLRSPDELYGQPARRYVVMVPIHSARSVRGLAAFVVDARGDPTALAASRERLELTAGLLTVYEMRLTLSRRQADLQRLRMAMETLAAVNAHDRFAGAAMTACNEIATRWRADRASLGFLKGRYVKLRAMSHTEKFVRKTQIIQDLEAAMEECLDQDVEVVYPTAAEATYVSRAAARLAEHAGRCAVVALPLRHAGEPVAVLVLERPADRPFDADEVESLRLAADLCAARLVGLEAHDRWFGARMAAALKKGLAVAVGPKHTWAKLAAVAGLGAALFLALAKGEYRVESPFVLEAIQRQVIPAPFDGYLKDVFVEPDAPVEAAKTVLATLDTSELLLARAQAEAERAKALKEAAAAKGQLKEAEAQIALALADKAKAEVDLLDYTIRQAVLTSPLSGRIVTGDLKRQIGAPVKRGDVLFEVAPIENLRAELYVSDDLIADVAVGQEGELATASYPELRVRFVVERINPVADVVKQRNVFKVRVKLLGSYPWMRPGMEGVSKVDICRAHYAWIWTRRLVNWVRMKLWI